MVYNFFGKNWFLTLVYNIFRKIGQHFINQAPKLVDKKKNYGAGWTLQMGRSAKRYASPVAGQACPVVADGPELLCGLHLAAWPQKLSSEIYNEPSCPEARHQI